MHYHKQLYRHDPDNGVIGDCYRTVLACLLEKDSPEDVPHFAKDTWGDGVAFEAAFDAWLRDEGHMLAKAYYYQCSVEEVLALQGRLNPGVFYLLSGMSVRGVNHTVIGMGGEIWWDTHPDDSGLTGPLDNGFVEVAWILDSRQICRT